MPSWFRTIIDVMRARNAAIASIRPLVEDSRQRLGGISDAVWLEPYMLGFIAMLITVTAKHRISDLEGQAMSQVQAEAWQAITGLDYQLGEEIILLSEARDPQFTTGCSDALTIASDFYSSGVLGAPTEDNDERGDGIASNGTASAQAIRAERWRQVFDSYISNR